MSDDTKGWLRFFGFLVLIYLSLPIGYWLEGVLL